MYYIPYDETRDIDYIFLLCLYGITQRNKDKLYNIITYDTIQKLCDTINKYYKDITNNDKNIISKSKLDRIINNEIYQLYFTIDKKQKQIIINNNFRKGKNDYNRFITISKSEANYFCAQRDNLLCKYYFYIKYYTGYSKNKTTDFTAKQFLCAIGYSANTNNYISRLCDYNNKLKQQNLISIKKYRDNNGHERNIYSLIV